MKKAVLCVLVVCLLASFAFAGGKSEQGATKPGQPKKVEIRWLTNNTKAQPGFEMYVDAIERMKKDYPHIDVIIEGLESAQMRTKILTEMAAGNPPNAAAGWINYAREFIKDGKIADWNPILADPKYKDLNKRVTPGLKVTCTDEQGRMLLYPGSLGVDGLFYNKEIFAKYGWQPPKTFDELIVLVKQCREKGIYGMVTGGKDLRFAWFAAMLMVRTAGTQRLTELTLGDKKDKWDDPLYGFPQAAEKFKQLVDAGAFPKGTNALSRDEADQMFCRGEVAMYYEGNWLLQNFTKIGGPEFVKKVGRVNFPVMTDMPKGDPNAIVTAINGSIIASAKFQTPEQLDASIRCIQYLNDDIIARNQMEIRGTIYANVEFDRSKAPEAVLACVDIIKTAPAFGAPLDTIAAPAIDSAVKKTAFPMILNGSSVKDAVAEVQKVASDYVKSLEKK
jgi:raffinose/stachyose/melibiose transport system substrate-binding protein